LSKQSAPGLRNRTGYRCNSMIGVRRAAADTTQAAAVDVVGTDSGCNSSIHCRRRRRRLQFHCSRFIFLINAYKQTSTNTHLLCCRPMYFGHAPYVGAMFDTNLETGFGCYSLCVLTQNFLPYAVLAVIACPSVCPSIRHKPELYQSKRLNVGSQKQRRTIAQGL